MAPYKTYTTEKSVHGTSSVLITPRRASDQTWIFAADIEGTEHSLQFCNGFVYMAAPIGAVLIGMKMD